MLLKSESIEVMFRNTALLINKEDFNFLRDSRAERIATGRFFLAGTPNGVVARDRLAMRGQLLEVGGEVTGAELSIIVSTMSSERNILDKEFGKDWLSDW